MISLPSCFCFVFFNDTATTEIYTLSLHDALPIFEVSCEEETPWRDVFGASRRASPSPPTCSSPPRRRAGDRKSTRLNSSHSQISYAVFCLKKKKKKNNPSSDRHIQRDHMHAAYTD